MQTKKLSSQWLRACRSAVQLHAEIPSMPRSLVRVWQRDSRRRAAATSRRIHRKWEQIKNSRENFTPPTSASPLTISSPVSTASTSSLPEPAPEDVDLNIYTVKELRVMCKNAKVVGYSRMKKAEMVEALSD